MEYVPGDSLNFHGNISDLMPYTTYMVKVSVISRGGQGMPSDPQLATTLESAPEPPRDVTVLQVTNTSIHVAWKPPNKTNGYLQKYEIHYNKNVTTVDGSETVSSFFNYSKFNPHFYQDQKILDINASLIILNLTIMNIFFNFGSIN